MEIQNKITLPRLTSYEKSELIAQRIIDLDNGAKSTIEDIIKQENLYRTRDIAIREYEEMKLPDVDIIGKFPNGDYEIWKLKEFKYFPRSINE